jgi:hypothetical protein
MEGEVVNKKKQFNMNRNQAKANLTRRLGRNPTAAEILGLVGTRRKGLNENSFFAGLMKKAESRASAAAEVKMAAKAAAAEVRMKQKANAEARKLAERAEKEAAKLAKKGEGKGAKTAARKMEAELKKAAAEQNKLAKKEAKGLAKAAKEAARESAKEQFAEIERVARNNLTRALGKAPRVANIRRLASIRHSGVNLSVNDFMRVKNYAATRKAGTLMKTKIENLEKLNLGPMDPCEACELKKFLEKEE